MTGDPIVLQALDHVVAVHLDGPAATLAPDLRRAWSRCLAKDLEAQSSIHVSINNDAPPQRTSSLVRAPHAAAAMELLTQAVTLAGIEAGAGRLLMLHACGLVHPSTGDAMVLVAPSGTGKSTAARDLGRSWGYLSDETVAVREDGSLVAYPKPLSLIEGGDWKRQVSPDDLGLLVAPSPTRGTVTLLDRRSGPPARRRLPMGESLARLAEHTSYLSRLRRPLHVLADALDHSGVEVLGYETTAQLGSMLADGVADG